MRWIKHLAVAHDDSKINVLRQKLGPAGYGAYWLVLERIACQMNGPNPSTSLSDSIKGWARYIGCYTSFVVKLCECCSSVGLMYHKCTEDVLNIDCPNLLKYKDEYLRKSGATPEENRTEQNRIEQIDMLSQAPAALKLKKATKEQKPKTDHTKLIEFWNQEYQTRFPSQKYVFQGGKDGKSVATILQRIGLEEAKRLVGLFFQTTDRWIIENGGFTIPMFLSQINKLAQKAPTSQERAIEEELDRM